VDAGSMFLGRHPLDVLRLSHSAIESASRDGVFFFATTGDLPIPTTFWGGIRAAVICSGSPGRTAGHSYPKSWLPQITWNTASMRA
jgi:hypothetical protein